MQADWELSQTLTSDGQGIRSACVCSGDASPDMVRIVAGNQGGGMWQFGVPSGSLLPIEFQHDHAVTALLTGDDCYVTGCKDNKIRIFSPTSNQLIATLAGHEKPVTSLAWASNSTDGTKFLVSGSWDGTAKIWNLAQRAMVATLPGHENSVCVAGMASSATTANTLTIATGSAGIAQNNSISGHTIRLWTVNISTGQTACVQQVSNDHDGPIRDIAALPNCLASCSNDGTVKLRSMDTGDCFSTLIFLQKQDSHPPMLLSVTGLADSSSIAASAEDGHVIVWSDLESGSDPQIILHPSCVWNIVALPNGDLATCCQDGILRIFTRSTERYAPAAEREQFEKLVQEGHQKKSTGPSAEEVAKLPLWEMSGQKRGTSEGQVQLFNKNSVAIAAQWSMASQTWIEVGQVLGSNDGGLVDGAQYDHVFPIEVDQTGGGVASLKIGYNDGENPFVAAQRFIDAHVLPQYHLNDIANYIEQRVGRQGQTLGGTGVGSGAAAIAPVAAAGVPMVAFQYLPAPSYKSFELPSKSAAVTLEKMKNKIQEFGKMSDAQISQISTLMETLAATSRYHASKIQASELAVISEMLQLLPVEEAFPALDLARLTVTHPDAASSANSAYWTKLLEKVLSMCEQPESLQGPAAVAIPMLSLRLFANAFRGGPGSLEAAANHLEAIVACAAKFVKSTNKNVRISIATVLYNVSFFVHSKNPGADIAAIQLVSVADAILSARSYEGEAVIRTLIALGTTALGSPLAKERGRSMFIHTKVELAASPHGDVAKTTAKEVYNALA
jgi:phospholipase A-2-activating protein